MHIRTSLCLCLPLPCLYLPLSLSVCLSLSVSLCLSLLLHLCLYLPISVSLSLFLSFCVSVSCSSLSASLIIGPGCCIVHLASFIALADLLTDSTVSETASILPPSGHKGTLAGNPSVPLSSSWEPQTY